MAEEVGHGRDWRPADGDEEAATAAADGDEAGGGSMTDGGCCSPVRERIDDGGVEPRWRRPTGKEMGTLLCSALTAAIDLQKRMGLGLGDAAPKSKTKLPGVAQRRR